mmetsp:Transcript_91961/g.259797  ORF Transcript_91961/g.259797 Transcript_91961/m.259797 type:complete len:567 (+) Transcript_91961:67-1767(+)
MTTHSDDGAELSDFRGSEVDESRSEGSTLRNSMSRSHDLKTGCSFTDGFQCSSKDSRENMMQQYISGNLRFSKAPYRRRARALVVSAPWIIVQVLAIIVDFFHMFQLWHCEKDCLMNQGSHVWFIAIILNTIYLLDVLMRIFAFGPRLFVSKFWNIVELVTVVLAGAGTVWVFMVSNRYLPCEGLFRLTLYVRIMRMFRLTTMGRRTTRGCRDCMRHVTGENKRRFLSAEFDFNLDLAYITPRLIGMSVPAGGALTQMYRNPISEVARFLETFHYEHYMIANLCPEMPYPAAKFKTGMVQCFDIQDHMPPRLQQFLDFLVIAEQWCKADTKNIIVVHCRGGKGRTGSFCCAVLLYAKRADDAADAMNFFAMQRTDLEHKGIKVQGVETPSQVRYITYIDELLKEQNAYSPILVKPPKPVGTRLETLTAHSLFKKGPEEAVVAIQTLEDGRTVFWSEVGRGEWGLHSCPSVFGDIRVSVFGRKGMPKEAKDANLANFRREEAEANERKQKRFVAGKEPGCLFYFIIHTSFLPADSELSLPMPMIDGACKHPKRYDKHGKLVMRFSCA